MKYRNATHAFVSELAQLRERGQVVEVRGATTTELLSRLVVLERPTERFITVPGRRNDPWATVAETMWVIAGREDVAYLERYLPRAPDYSDDGQVWRGAYGPRIRDWAGTDQVDEVRQLLLNDPLTRRAVINIFDPARDFIETRDVPCNNWIHFIQRDGRLDMNVAIRSNDIVWGFSGINTFEWSVLHEMMAYWTGFGVGHCSYFISSLHFYNDRLNQVDRTLSGFSGGSGYEAGWVAPSFITAWEDFPMVMQEWFRIEHELASGADAAAAITQFPDPLLRHFLELLRIKWLQRGDVNDGALMTEVENLGRTDGAFALRELLFRDSALIANAGTAHGADELRDDISRLHRMKDAAYGDAWKRRGELISIASNLARKADRIGSVTAGAPAGSESLLDTAVDLLVYALKYQLFIMEHDSELAAHTLGTSGLPFSDGTRWFDALLWHLDFDVQVGSVEQEAVQTVTAFNRLDELLQDTPEGPWATKQVLAEHLTVSALRLVHAVAAVDWGARSALRREARGER
ncbi:thymidylate synthase [Agromyces mariniharenae]|nr:thymidylate synthase [Agromyces mariniharenae]